MDVDKNLTDESGHDDGAEGEDTVESTADEAAQAGAAEAAEGEGGLYDDSSPKKWFIIHT